MVPKCHPKIVAVNTETNNSPMFRNTHMDALLKNCIEELNQDFQVELSRTAFLCSLLLTYVVAVPSLPISNVQYPTDQLNLIPFSQPRSFSPSLT